MIRVHPAAVLAASQLLDARLKIVEGQVKCLGFRPVGSRRNPAARSTPTLTNVSTSKLSIPPLDGHLI